MRDRWPSSCDCATPAITHTEKVTEMSEAPDLTISQQLAQWAGELTWDDVPLDVLHETKLRVLDITGAMLGGLDTDLVAQLARAAAGASRVSGWRVEEVG